MLDSLDKYLPKEIKFTRPEGGLFIWCTLPDGVDMMEFVRAALAEKVAVVAGTAFNCDTEAPSPSFRLNFSTPSDEQIVEGVSLSEIREKAPECRDQSPRPDEYECKERAHRNQRQYQA